MEYFCAIVEEGQISKAAKRLNLSQPPLSMRLKEIEQEIGRPLILRSPGVWKVTTEGRLLYNKCRQILTHIQGLAESVRNANESCRGSVRIGIGSHCVSFFQKIVPELAARYPDISCRTVIADSPTVERYLQEREVELAILRLNMVNNNCSLFNLPQQRLVAVFSHHVPPRPTSRKSPLTSLKAIRCFSREGGRIPKASAPSWRPFRPGAANRRSS